MQRAVCGGCGSANLDVKLSLGRSPLADEFPTSQAEAVGLPTWPLGLMRCGDCTLIQLSEIVPDDVLWGGEYGFYSGSSSVVVVAQEQYAKDLIRDYPRLAKQLTVEIACNDGTMLRHFRAAGYPTLGVDPARGPAQKAADAGLDVWVEPFGAGCAQRIVNQHGHAGLIVANNVIAHVADLDDFLGGLRILLAPTGVLVVEFQYVADLILGNQIDHLYHEHRQFFSLTSLNRALRRHGLQATSVKQTAPQGGSLRVVIRKTAYGLAQPDHTVGHLLHAEKWLSESGCLDGMQGRANRLRDRLRDMLHQLKLNQARVAGYGASAKSTTLLNWCDIGPDLVQYMVDTTPTKHGHYTPGTGIPIVCPSADSRAPDAYLLTVWNYLPEILRRERQFTDRGGRWLIPIPTPVLL